MLIFSRPVSMKYVSTPSAMLASDEPMAAMRMPRLPPSLSTSGPLTRKDSAYVQVPAAKMRPKSSLVISVPNAFLETFRL